MVYLVVLRAVSLASATRSSMVSHHVAKFTESGLYSFVCRIITHAICIAAGVGRAFSHVSLSVCPRCKRKMA